MVSIYVKQPKSSLNQIGEIVQIQRLSIFFSLETTYYNRWIFQRLDIQ